MLKGILRATEYQFTWISISAVFTKMKRSDHRSCLLWSWTSLIIVVPVWKPDFQTLFRNVQNQKELISAMRSSGPLTQVDCGHATTWFSRSHSFEHTNKISQIKYHMIRYIEFIFETLSKLPTLDQLFNHSTMAFPKWLEAQNPRTNKKKL